MLEGIIPGMSGGGILGKDTKCLGFPMKCLITMALILYMLSPIDLIPELFFGPIGLIDDAGALLLALFMNRGMFGNLGGMFK